MFARLCHALTLAADQNSRHLVSGFAGCSERGEGPMPARMVGIVPGGTSLAGIALSASCTMKHGFVRTGGPVLVNIEFRSAGGCSRSCGPGYEAGVSSDLLELGSGIAPHRQKRQPVDLLDPAHHGERCLDGQRIGLDEV